MPDEGTALVVELGPLQLLRHSIVVDRQVELLSAVARGIGGRSSIVASEVRDPAHLWRLAPS